MTMYSADTNRVTCRPAASRLPAETWRHHCPQDLFLSGTKPTAAAENPEPARPGRGAQPVPVQLGRAVDPLNLGTGSASGTPCCAEVIAVGRRRQAPCQARTEETETMAPSALGQPSCRLS